MTNTQFEQMQFSNEVNQGQDFDSTDTSKVDQYKPYNYDCGSYTPRYSRRWTNLDADSNEQDFDN
jgi:hypothetical protein